jgi:hypothetical protein
MWALALFGFASSGHAQVQASLQSVQDAQIQVQASTSEFVAQLLPIFKELGDLGAAEADLTLVKETLTELTALSDAEMRTILTALTQALEAPDSLEADANLKFALAGQTKVVVSLQGVFERLRDRQLELAVASKAEALRRRQVKNQHLTELLQLDIGDPVIASAEQAALGDAIAEFVRELASIQDSAQEEASAPSRIDSGVFTQLKQITTQATEQLEQKYYYQATQTQKQIGEMLADLAAETGLEQSSGEFLQDLARQLQDLKSRQAQLQADTRSGDTAQEQAGLAVATESLRVPVENIHAPAAFQVANAAKAMRAAAAKLLTEPVQGAEDDQDLAQQSLQRAIELLQQSSDDLENKSDASAGEVLDELAEMYRQADQLAHRQNQQNQSGGSQQNQAQIARETAELQAAVAEHSPEAARDLGRAAARMAEALTPSVGQGERDAMLGEAAEKLSQATQAILSEGRSLKNQKPGPGGGGQSIDAVVLEDDILGAPVLNAVERTAIESARREPVSPEYAPLVEAYYDKLSRLSEMSE